MNKEPRFFEALALIILFVLAVFVVSDMINQLNKVGETHHGIVVQEICNGSNSYVTIDYGNLTSKTVSYRITKYENCLDFLYHHGYGVTITDNAWGPYIISYRWD